METIQFVKYFCPECKKEVPEEYASGYEGLFIHLKRIGGCEYSGNQENVIEVFDVEAAGKYVLKTSSDLRAKINNLEKNFISEGLKNRAPLENFLKE